MLKVLNGYAGIGGNRKLWKDVEVIAVEINPDIAAVYQKNFPEDTVIVTNAKEYLLKHYKEFDFIWLSPPCPSHSDIRRCGVHRGQYDAIYPDMTLYEIIILLKHFALRKTLWVVENVKPYYDYLIEPTQILNRHPFWSNFNIYLKDIHDTRKHDKIVGSETVYGFNIKDEQVENKRKVIRNMVNPKIGNYILNCARGILDEADTKQLKLF